MPPASTRSACPPLVILDTDMGNDIDDALALVMLHALQRAGACELAGVTVSKANPWAAAFTRLVNARCGAPSIPVGLVGPGGATPEDGKFIRQICEAAGQKTPGESEDAVRLLRRLLRRLLAARPDASVTIISIGFFTNLSRLLASEADEFSPLSGRELIAKKVSLVCSMAGNFRPSAAHASGPDAGNPEFNIRTDIAAARAFIDGCPCPMVFSGFEVGEQVMFPGSSIERVLARDPANPVAAAYAAYIPMPYDRQSWDQTAVLHGVSPEAGYFDLSPAGRVRIDETGYSRFEPQPGGLHRYLILDPARLPRVRDAIIRLGLAFTADEDASSSRVLVVGSSNFDLTLYCECLPGPGETILGGRTATAIGGKGANQATAARRAGVDTTFFSAVGDDANGALIRAYFADESVTTSWAPVAPGAATGLAMILVDRAGRNSIAVAPGANAAIEPSALDAIRFADFGHVLLSLEIPLPVVAEAARRARAAGCVVVLNPAPAAALPDDLLRQVDILVPNEHEVAALSPEKTIDAGAARFFALGGRALVVTLGEAGVRIITREGSRDIPAQRVAAVDSVGAGDCFCGVLTAALAEGLDLPAAAARANQAAALSVQTAGAIPSFPRRDRILANTSG